MEEIFKDSGYESINGSHRDWKKSYFNRTILIEQFGPNEGVYRIIDIYRDNTNHTLYVGYIRTKEEWDMLQDMIQI